LRDSGEDNLAVVVRGCYALFGENRRERQGARASSAVFHEEGHRTARRQLREGQERGLDHRLD